MGAPPKNLQLVEPTTVRERLERPTGERVWLRVERAATKSVVRLNGEVVAEHLGAWTPIEVEVTGQAREGANEVEVATEDVIHTTNGFLPDIDMRWTGATGIRFLTAATPERAAVKQRSAVRGDSFLVDGEPFGVRGILHWGYYPELGNPWPSEATMRDEIALMQSYGFNLIKFCLWVPPLRYYELCDEMGMLVWQEYPCWNAALDDPGIEGEYRAMYRQDRCYPCVVLRTLTCENDRVKPEVGAALVAAAREEIPGCVILDNSAWLCKERVGDFHDEHPYLHNAQWKYYGERMRPRISKPLMLGETICCDTLEDGHYETAMAVREWQVKTLRAELPKAGYVLNVIRDIAMAPLGICKTDGTPKYGVEDWAWQRDEMERPARAIREVGSEGAGRIIGPRKGEWKHTDWTWWSPVVKVLEASLPAEMIVRESVFDLLSGRVLTHTEGTRVLVEAWDVHSGKVVKRPLVIDFKTAGVHRIVSAFRHDTPAGRALWEALEGVDGSDAPEIGRLVGNAIVLEDWRMRIGDAGEWVDVKCDTPLVNGGKNIFEGWATFRTEVALPGKALMLQCDATGDYYEFDIFAKGSRDSLVNGAAGPRDGTWDGVRDIPKTYRTELAAGDYEIEFRVRDWRGGGGMVGPVYFAEDLDERIL